MYYKSFVTLFLLIFTCKALAVSNEEFLSDWTEKNEIILLKNNHVIDSLWFQEKCLSLAKELQFSKINKCVLLKTENINAYVLNNGHVYFSTAMLEMLNNKHQWASILAHENAHLVLNHYIKTLKIIKKPSFLFHKRKIRKLQKQHEKDADIWSKNRLQSHGFGANQIDYFLKRVEKKLGNKKSKNHLRISTRLHKNINKEIIDESFIENIKHVIACSNN